MAARRKRRCTRYGRTRDGRRVCRKYTKVGSYRRRRATTSRRRKPAGMARRGSKCIRFKRVRVRGQGMARRCAKFRR